MITHFSNFVNGGAYFMSEKRVNLFGVEIDDVSLSQCSALAQEGLQSGEKRVFFTPNLEMLSGAKKSDGICRVLNSADVSLPDGFGVRLVSFLLGREVKNTAPGIDFGEELLKMANECGYKVFLLGGKDGIAQKAAKNIKSRYKNIEICGTHTGYFLCSEEDMICKKINSSGADILFVCRGFPRQESFVTRSRHKLYSVKVIACLGGTLDVWAGISKRAPAPIRKMHLEWLWRIASDKSGDRLQRFISSLPVLFDALLIYFKNILAKIRIKSGALAYNRTDANS